MDQELQGPPVYFYCVWIALSHTSRPDNPDMTIHLNQLGYTRVWDCWRKIRSQFWYCKDSPGSSVRGEWFCWAQRLMQQTTLNRSSRWQSVTLLSIYVLGHGFAALAVPNLFLLRSAVAVAPPVADGCQPAARAAKILWRNPQFRIFCEIQGKLWIERKM